jgi:hypothetical protein
MNISKVLVPVSWTLWGALLLVLLWVFLKVLTEKSHSPEAAPGLGAVVMGLLLVVFAGVGLWLTWATRRGAMGALITLTLLLAFPIVLLIASPIVSAWKTWRLESQIDRVGDFPDPSARALAERIQSGDASGLQRLLVEAGASVDERLPGGESMLVRFVGLRQWDSALYLIEKGAKLDVTNPRGLSLDYYLKDWKESVYGDHPEGWDRVRAAIQSRRRP